MALFTINAAPKTPPTQPNTFAASASYNAAQCANDPIVMGVSAGTFFVSCEGQHQA